MNLFFIEKYYYYYSLTTSYKWPWKVIPHKIFFSCPLIDFSPRLFLTLLLSISEYRVSHAKRIFKKKNTTKTIEKFFCCVLKVITWELKKIREIFKCVFGLKAKKSELWVIMGHNFKEEFYFHVPMSKLKYHHVNSIRFPLFRSIKKKSFWCIIFT